MLLKMVTRACGCSRFLQLLIFVSFLLTLLAAEESKGDGHTRFYDLLKVDKNASAAEIKRTYRRLSLELHPDKHQGDKEKVKQAEEYFQEVTLAYQVLSNKNSRQLYDAYGPQYSVMEKYYEELGMRGPQELYKYAKGVHLVFEGNVDTLLRNSRYIWILGFYQAGCGSCEQRVPVFKRLGQMTLRNEKVRLAMVNCQMSHLCQFFQIHNLAQIYFLPPQQENGEVWDKQSYEGGFNETDILEKAETVKAHNLHEGESDSEVISALRKVTIPPNFPHNGIVAAWLVDYYRPTCPPCRRLKGDLRRAAEELNSRMRVTMINCDKTRCDVPHYPYLRLYVKKGDGRLRAHSLDFDDAHESHPGALMARVTAFIMNTVLDLDPPAELKSPAQARAREEL